MSDRIQARWLPLYPVDVPGQGIVEPGGLAWIGAGEAKASDHWEPIKAAPDPEPVRATTRRSDT